MKRSSTAICTLIILVFTSACWTPMPNGPTRTVPSAIPSQATEGSSIPPSTSGPPTVATTLMTATRVPAPTISPDTSPRIVGITGAGGEDPLSLRTQNISTIHLDGSKFKQLTNNQDVSTEFREPAWSPDGSQILFLKREGYGNDFEIWTMNADGSQSRRLTDNASDEWGARWSPDGQHIVFMSRQRGQPTKVFLMRQDGSDLRRLTDSSDDDELEPQWSPAGDRIAFITARWDGSYPEWHLRMVKPDGSGESVWTPLHPPVQNMTSPRWSPDARQIIYGVGSPTGSWFELISTDGSRQTEVRIAEAMLSSPAWSSDGSHVILTFFRYSNAEVASLAVMDVRTLGWQVVAEDVDFEDHCWLPNGHQIVYNTTHDRNWGLWVVNADGTDARLVREHFAMNDCFPNASSHGA